ncbi:MAG: hypothetical protein LBB88_11660 [Planctomycetaceae bacterium]|nr:hypothetical protein [Planctomycetaceae bacterium]
MYFYKLYFFCGGHWGQRGLMGHWGHTNLKTKINDSTEKKQLLKKRNFFL